MRPPQRDVTDGLRPEQLPGAHHTNRASYSLTEVATHKTSDDGWIVIHGSVYNITNFIKHHPGWNRGGQTSTVLAIMRTLGTDCSEEFDSIHSAHAQRQLQLYRIGSLAEADDDRPPRQLTISGLAPFAWIRILGAIAPDDVRRLCTVTPALRAAALAVVDDSDDDTFRALALHVPPESVGAALPYDAASRTLTRLSLGRTPCLLAIPLDATEVSLAFEVEIVTMQAPTLEIGVVSADPDRIIWRDRAPVWSFDCAGTLRSPTCGRSAYGARVREGSRVAVALRARDRALLISVDGISLGVAARGVAARAGERLFPFVRFESAPGDAVRLLGQTRHAVISAASRSARPPLPPHKLDGRLVVRFAVDARDYCSFQLDPGVTTVRKLRALLRIVLRSRGMAAAKHVDIDILVGGGVCRDDDATLEKLGVTFEGGRAVQSRDVFANLPHLVS